MHLYVYLFGQTLVFGALAISKKWLAVMLLTVFYGIYSFSIGVQLSLAPKRFARNG